MLQKQYIGHQIKKFITVPKNKCKRILWFKAAIGFRRPQRTKCPVYSALYCSEDHFEDSYNKKETIFLTHKMNNDSPFGLDDDQQLFLQIPSPIVTRRTRTASTCEIAKKNPEVTGKVKYFCREKGHGFIIPEDGSEEIFVHISDIEGEYVPLKGDEVTYRLCPIPPKKEKYQATHVVITNFTPEVHQRWDCPPSENFHP